MSGARAQASNAASIKAAMLTIRDARGRARQFWRVFEGSRIPMVVVDNDRRHAAANVAARLVFRLSLDELLIRRMDHLVPAPALGTMFDRWRRLMREGVVFGSSDMGFPDGSELRVMYCALANVLPGQHLIVFIPADWPGGELAVLDEAGAGPPSGPLSRREREVLSLIAAGAGSGQIAEELMISVTTVRTHTRNALRKLGARTRAHAIALAMRDGMIDVAGPSVDSVASAG